MSALLEVPEIRRRALSVPVEAYHRFTEGMRTELLRGTIIEKMSKSPIHCHVADTLREILSGQITPPFSVLYEHPLTLTDSEPEPDICVVRGSKRDFRSQHPSTAELVVEVAVSSLEIDRVKAMIYAEAGVKEYWIVRPEEKIVEVYRSPAERGYGERSEALAAAKLECAALPGVSVDLAVLFA